MGLQLYVWIVGSGCHTHDYQEAAQGPINMVILVIMLFVTEYEYMAYKGNGYFTDNKVVHRPHHRAKLRHQAICFLKLLHVGGRMSSLAEGYQRSPQEHQAGFQDRQPWYNDFYIMGNCSQQYVKNHTYLGLFVCCFGLY